MPQTKVQSGSAKPWTPEAIQKRIHELGEWFHNMNLGGVQTAPNHFLGDYPSIKWKRFSHSIPADLRGKTVLDIGCNAGFYSFAMKKRGAERVLGIDSDEHYLDQARFAADVTGLDVEFRQLGVYDVQQLGEKFDLVLFLGVLYHLRYPLLALDLIRRHVAKDMLLVQSMLRGSAEMDAVSPDYPITETHVFERPGFPRMHFVERKYSSDPTNWWIPNAACLTAILRSSGFHILAHPEDEVFLTRVSEVSEIFDVPSIAPAEIARSARHD